VQKDFEKWSVQKKNIHNQSKIIHYHAGEIWWCYLGLNIGSEQDGTGKDYARPIVIVKDLNNRIFFGVALTGHQRSGTFYHYLGKFKNQHNTALLSQVRTLDSKRLIRKISTLDHEIFKVLKQKLQTVHFGN